MLHTDPPPRFPNIGYVGSTYNIFKGNPRSTKGLDPGFTLRNLCKLSYTKNLTTADGRYSIPDNTQATNSSACSFDFSSETTDSISSYYNSLKVDVSADFGGWGASFSANADYKEVHENSASHEYKYISSHATCQAYVASVQINAASFDTAFKIAVYALPPETTTLVDYINFIQHWGTHAVISLTMGGRYGIQSSMTNDKYTFLSATGLDINAAAKYSGVVSLNANVGTSIQKKQAKEFEDHRTDYQIYQIGGKPPLNETISTFEWAQTVTDNPLPLKYHLLPLTDYLTSQYFPNDKDISKRQSNLRKAFIEYCQSLDLPDISYCTNDGPSSTPKIEVTFVKTYRRLPCSDSNAPFYAPILRNPYYRVLGTMQSFAIPEYQPIVIINGENAPNELIRSAIDWITVYYDPEFNAIGFRPVCDNGFVSVSDIFCCGDSIECLNDLPITLPCVAFKCLSQCGYFGFHPHIFNNTKTMNWAAITFGSGFLGSNHFFDNDFVRLSQDETIELSANDRKCLNFKCLKFI